MKEAEIEFHEGEYLRLRALLEEEFAKCKLPEKPAAKDSLDDLLCRVRLAKG